MNSHRSSREGSQRRVALGLSIFASLLLGAEREGRALEAEQAYQRHPSRSPRLPAGWARSSRRFSGQGLRSARPSSESPTPCS